MVFEKAESWSFDSPGPADLFAESWRFWGERGYQLASTGTASFLGRSFHSRIGIYRVVEVAVLPSGSGALIQIRYRADVRPDVAAGGLLVAVVLWPLALAGAAVSWHEYESDWSRERWEFWRHLTSQSRARPSSVAPPPPTPAPLVPPPNPPE